MAGPGNLYLLDGRYIEQIALYPARHRRTQDLGADYPDLVHNTPNGTGATNGPRNTTLDFDADAVEAMDFNFHPVHHAADEGTCFIDLHYMMKTAHTGNVRLKFEAWLLSSGVDFGNISATPLVSDTWTLDPENGNTAQMYDFNFFAEGYSGAIRGNEMGSFSIADLQAAGFQNEWACKLTRLATDGLDTHTGDFQILRIEFHFPVNLGVLSIGV